MKFSIIYEKDKDRFFSKVNKTDFCWLWTAKVSQSIPLFWINKELYPAHYFSWQLANNCASVPGTLERTCLSKICVNPEHLKLVNKENLLSYARISSILEEESKKYVDSEVGYVYFVQCGDGPIKIGWSKDPQCRLLQLQQCNPFKLKLLFYFEAAKCIETILHKIFADWHIHHEWFVFAKEIKQFMDETQLKRVEARVIEE